MLTVNCPNCGKQTQYEGNEFRPFCSERCKLIDFGDWATERYSVPLQDETLSEEDLARIEQAVKGRSEDK